MHLSIRSNLNTQKGKESRGRSGRGVVGLLKTRPVHAFPVRRLIGKEGNKLEERELGLLDQSDEVQVEYVDPNAWRHPLKLLVKERGVGGAARDLGVDRGTVRRWIALKATPHRRYVGRIHQSSRKEFGELQN